MLEKSKNFNSLRPILFDLCKKKLQGGSNWPPTSRNRVKIKMCGNFIQTKKINMIFIYTTLLFCTRQNDQCNIAIFINFNFLASIVPTLKMLKNRRPNYPDNIMNNFKMFSLNIKRTIIVMLRDPPFKREECQIYNGTLKPFLINHVGNIVVF